MAGPKPKSRLPEHWAFHGGELDNPYDKGIHGVFLSESEAILNAPTLLERRGRFVSDRLVRYPVPVAWLVTFIVIMHETGESELHVEPTFGGECMWNDDRDVLAIFKTRAEAEAFASERR